MTSQFHLSMEMFVSPVPTTDSASHLSHSHRYIQIHTVSHSHTNGKMFRYIWKDVQIQMVKCSDTYGKMFRYMW